MFGGKSKEENRKEAVEEYVKKYQIEELMHDETVQRLAIKLNNAEVLNMATALSGNQSDRTKIEYLSALTEQNWLIINQLSRLNANIEKLANK